MNRRELLRLLSLAMASGLNVFSPKTLGAGDGETLYDVPPVGNVSLLHFTDSHAQLLPVYYREPDTNIGVSAARGCAPHLVGDALLTHFGLPAGARDAYAFTELDFVHAAQVYGKVGGFAHLATLVKRLRMSRPNALLLDGGDTWQGSATALWSQGQDMVDAQLELGVDVMTGHWEFTYGAERVQEIIAKDFHGKIDFVAQNVRTNDFDDGVFPPFVIRTVNDVAVAIIGQAFPYTPIAHPRAFVPDWRFGIQEKNLQSTVHEARKKGAQLVVLLSHNGMDVDLKLASRVTGIDAILGGHTHDGIPQPTLVRNAGGQTLVTNAGSNGKFLGILDLEIRGGTVKQWQYKLLPVFSNLLAEDKGMQAIIQRHRAPHRAKLDEVLATTEGLLYRRGNFNGTFDQLILDALLSVKEAQIAFSPGFRWGTTLLPGSPITLEHLMDMTAVTYPSVTVNELSGDRIKTILEDVCDNLFNPDPYLQQGGDMVRVGGLSYTCEPNAASGRRISDLRLNGVPLGASTTYKVAGWAPVGDTAPSEPIWTVVSEYLRHEKTILPKQLNLPKLVGVTDNPGIA